MITGSRKAAQESRVASSGALRGVFARGAASVDARDLALVDDAVAPSWSRRWLGCVCGVTLNAGMAGWLKLRVEGIEQVPTDGPLLFVSNHTSHLDTAVIRRGVGRYRARRLQVMAARDYFFGTKLKTWFYGMLFNTLPFEREHGSLRGLELCRLALAGGCSVLIYPEGTRSKTGEMRAFRSGIGILAVELGLPVIPVHVEGAFAALPPGRRFPRRGPITVRFGSPIDLATVLENSRVGSPRYRAATQHIQQAVASLDPRSCP
ncbi:MAG: 1-acyl-sn-glycerol-3-phosphate acyltransferase [Planctomycetes bacterium]|nr:1-acyl-sn-glycerol-3-phosphate acyltransferase [Planctomycetota bacterium]